MDGDKKPGETVPMVQLNDQNSNNLRTAPSSPTLSHKSITITNQKKDSQSVSIDVSGEIPVIKKTVTQEKNAPIPSFDDIIEILPPAMKNKNNSNTEDGKTKSGSEDVPEGFNRYRNEKSFSQGLWNIALLMTNLIQLKTVLNNHHHFYYTMLTLIILSIILQIGVGVALILSGRFDVNNEEERKTIYRMGTFVAIFVFFVMILNIIIEVFYNNDYPAVYQATPNPNDTKSR